MHFFSHDSCPATKPGLGLPQNFIISSFYVPLRNRNILVCSWLLFLFLAGLIFSPPWWLWSSLPPPFLASLIPPLSACKHTWERSDGKLAEVWRGIVISVNISSHSGRRKRKIFHIKQEVWFTASLSFEHMLYYELPGFWFLSCSFSLLHININKSTKGTTDVFESLNRSVRFSEYLRAYPCEENNKGFLREEMKNSLCLKVAYIC